MWCDGILNLNDILYNSINTAPIEMKLPALGSHRSDEHKNIKFWLSSCAGEINHIYQVHIFIQKFTSLCLSYLCDSNAGNFVSIGAVFIKLYTIYFASTSKPSKLSVLSICQTCTTGMGLAWVQIFQPLPVPQPTHDINSCGFHKP